MKRKRKTGLVCCSICLIVLILVYVSLINRQRENVEETTDTIESETIISLKREDIVSMSYPCPAAAARSSCRPPL